MAAEAKNGQSLLVVVDPTTESQPAIERAAWLAQRDGYAIELFICDHDDYLDADGYLGPSDFAHVRETMMRSRRDMLRALAEPLIGQGLQVTCDIAWDRPVHEGVVRRVMRGPCALVLKDTHHHSALRRSIFSNTDWNLIRTCPAPLWLVKANTHIEGKCVLAAVDPRHSHDKPAALDDKILTTAGSIAGNKPNSLQVLHTYNVAYAGVSSDAVTAPALLEKEIRQMHEVSLQQLVDRHQIPAEDVNLLPGHPVIMLPKLAHDLNAGVMVMGSVARGRWRRILVGNTAEKVMDQLPCDLLVVKPDDFETTVQQLPYKKETLDDNSE